MKHTVYVYDLLGTCTDAQYFDRWIDADTFAYARMAEGNIVTLNGVCYNEYDSVCNEIFNRAEENASEIQAIYHDHWYR